MDMTTAEAAGRLGVSQRQVERLVTAGVLNPTQIVGRTWMVDAASVQKLAVMTRQKGRPWQEATAWAGLWLLSGLEVAWVDGQTCRRLNRRLKVMGAAELSWACRGRARVERYRASRSFFYALSTRFRATGSNAVEVGRDMLAPDGETVDAYVTAAERDAAVVECFLTPDREGNVTLRVTDLPAVEAWQGKMPVAVVGLDLSESTDPRESAAGARLLEGLLR